MLRVTPPHSTDCVRVRRRIYLHMSVYYVCSSPTHTALPHTQLTTDTANMHTYLQYIYRLVYACVRASVCVSYIISIYYKCLLVCVCVCVRACVCVCVCLCHGRCHGPKREHRRHITPADPIRVHLPPFPSLRTQAPVAHATIFENSQSPLTYTV